MLFVPGIAIRRLVRLFADRHSMGRDARMCRQEHDGILAACLKRVGRWRLPPNWSHHDWMEEAKGHAALAACQAFQDYLPEKGIPLEQFIRHRVMANILTRYRQEWSYARHCRHQPELESFHPVAPNLLDGNLLRNSVQELLARLSIADQNLIQQVFYDRRTEADIALSLGITQQAVSKRKGGILNQLRGALENA
jgi:DNA-directed RNA polymerase specialized sigma24 family protein